jgi:hypothetical protein
LEVLNIKKKLTIAQEKEMCELYKQGASIQELMALFGVAYNTARSCLLKNDAWGGRNSPIVEHYKLCGKCGKHCDLESRFCSMCGFRFKSEREVLADKLCGLVPDARYLPEASRDRFQQTLLEAATILASTAK